MFKIIFIILLVLGFGVNNLSFAMRCGSSRHQHTAQTQSTPHKHMETEAITSFTPKEVLNVDNKICPVSGEKIDEKTKVAYAHEGKTYNFCCVMCIEEFKKDPEKYIKKVEEELEATAAETKESSKETEIPSPPELPVGMHEGHHHR